MIARTTFKYILIAAAFLLLFSCSKSFMDKTPQSSLTTGNFPNVGSRCRERTDGRLRLDGIIILISISMITS